MYVLVKAIGVKKGQGERYLNVDISAIPVYQLFITYRKLYITLTNVFLANPVDVELSSLREKYSTFEGTLAALFIFIGTDALTTTDTKPTLNSKYATYSDAFRAGYKVCTLDIKASIDANLPPSSKTSLRFNRVNPPTDMDVFQKNCIVSINGFFHKTDFDGTYVYVVGGNSSRIKSHQNQMGFLSFLNLGQIENVSITQDMMFTQSVDARYKDKVYIKLDKDISNKTVILVLGGYLMFIDNKSFMQTGENVFMVDVNSIPFIERFYEAMPYLDYTMLGLPVNDKEPTAIDVNDLLSDDTLVKYFTMPQSFFCIVDTPEIFTNRIPVKSSGLPGMFIGYKEPKYPLIVSNGRVAEYWKTFEDGQWAINVHDSFLHNRVFSTVPVSALRVITDANVPATRARNSSGYLLEIGKDY